MDTPDDVQPTFTPEQLSMLVTMLNEHCLQLNARCIELFKLLSLTFEKAKLSEAKMLLLSDRLDLLTETKQHQAGDIAYAEFVKKLLMPAFARIGKHTRERIAKSESEQVELLSGLEQRVAALERKTEKKKVRP